MRFVGLIAGIILFMIELTVFNKHYDFTAYEEYLNTPKIMQTPGSDYAAMHLTVTIILMLGSSILFAMYTDHLANKRN